MAEEKKPFTYEATAKFILDLLGMNEQISSSIQKYPNTPQIKTPSKIKQNRPFIEKVKQIASRLGIKPEYLMGIMEIESGGTFSPSIRNSLGYVGLIQFGAAAAKSLGTTQNKLAAMSDIEQLDYVEKYFRIWKIQPNSPPSSLYTAVFLPAYVNKPDNFIFPEQYWEQNPALRDKSKNDKRIWKGYLGKLVEQKSNQYKNI